MVVVVVVVVVSSGCDWHALRIAAKTAAAMKEVSLFMQQFIFATASKTTPQLPGLVLPCGISDDRPVPCWRDTVVVVVVVVVSPLFDAHEIKNPELITRASRSVSIFIRED